ncbi:MAG: DEAD/DEAH box helicase [Desulfurivibrionaceae bacterium]|nr:DEAD/DEAH box helicase [Desulfurivibrionaceae bacterium]
MSFEKFNFDQKIVAGIEACGYKTPTPIQAQAIPEVINGRDIMGLAQTGTGKTAAFVLPILQKLIQGPRRRVRAVIVAPTRELAEQIHDNISELGRQTGLRSVAVYGGVSKFGQLKMFKSGVEIVVACPGRLLDHLDSRDLDLSGVEMLVLDEADMMFDMGFMPAIKRLLKYLPQKRQNLLFSATMPNEIRHLADSILKDPARVQINHSRPTALVSHKLYRVEKAGKPALLKQVIQDKTVSTALVFTRTKHVAKKLALNLEKDGHRAVALQGNMSQNKRKEAMDGFRGGRFNIMVATDIAARGIDVSGISHVINYDVPATVEAYTHRIGRTGRADRTGEAFTFATSEDRLIVRQIEQTIGARMIVQDQVVNGQTEVRSRPSMPVADGDRAGRPAGKGGAKTAGISSAKKGRNGGGGGHSPRNGGPGKATNKPRRQRSAPLGVDFFTQPRRSGAKTGGDRA